MSLDDDDQDDFVRRQQSEVERLKNRNRTLEDDIRKLTDVRPNASVSIDARGNSVVDRSAQHTNRYNSVAVSTKSIDQ